MIAQASTSVHIRLMFQAMVTRSHSPLTSSRPRIENARLLVRQADLVGGGRPAVGCGGGSTPKSNA
ncbi:MAG: hypothetical protein KIS73_17000 [Enhydrobacter sp.]|nr:hypothetical protein [Enhydrobacter sp.]